MESKKLNRTHRPNVMHHNPKAFSSYNVTPLKKLEEEHSKCKPNAFTLIKKSELKYYERLNRKCRVILKEDRSSSNSRCNTFASIKDRLLKQKTSLLISTTCHRHSKKKNAIIINRLSEIERAYLPKLKSHYLK